MCSARNRVWDVVYYQLSDGVIPALDFLDQCPTGVEAKLLAVLEVVRAGPPPRFSGGGYWEAMHGSMRGYYEIRCIGPGRKHYRLFCLLENGDRAALNTRGLPGPSIIVLNGLTKANATLFTEATYRKNVRKLGDNYWATSPRPIAR